MAKKYEVEFKCPQCKEKCCLQENLVSVEQYTNITTVADSGAVNYGHHSFEGGSVQGYACGHCGNYLRNNLLYAGGLVRDNMTLFRWLRDHNCLVSVEQDEQCPEMQQEEIKNGE